VNLYAVVARGYKSGGFTDYTTQVADGEPLKAAVVNSVEFGFKADSADRRFVLNGAVFLNRVKDDHLLGYDAVTFASLGLNTDTRSQGAELEGTWRIGTGWTVSGGVNFTDAKITRDLIGAGGGDVMAGNRLPDVARWSALLNLAYHTALTSFWGLQDPSLEASATYRRLGRRSADPQNHFDLDAYRKLDLRIGVASGGTGFFVWGDNLLNQRHELYGYFYAPGVSAGMVSRGRTLGFGMSHEF
jgi:iron complex outermembrane receptor protein